MPGAGDRAVDACDVTSIYRAWSFRPHAFLYVLRVLALVVLPRALAGFAVTLKVFLEQLPERLFLAQAALDLSGVQVIFDGSVDLRGSSPRLLNAHGRKLAQCQPLRASSFDTAEEGE